MPPPVARRVLPPVAASEAASLISLIERASADPSVDLDRLERLYAMYEKASARAARSAFLDALMAAKSALPRIIKTGDITGNVKDDRGAKVGKKKQSTYAKWEEVCAQIEPVLAAHGLVLSFRTEQPAGDRVSVTGILSHRDGHSESAQMALSADTSGGKNNAQGWGSAVSYGKRYTAFALLNLVGHDDKDTDGVTTPSTIDAEQVLEITKALAAKRIVASRFCDKYGLDEIADLPASLFAEAMGAIANHKGGAA